MPVEEAPDDDDGQLRQSYNFAPGYHGLIYRANTSDRGGKARETGHDDETQQDGEDEQPSPKKVKLHHSSSQSSVEGHATRKTQYKLQAAKWGLIPFWTKRPPDYGSQMRTINCRDDSLIENRGMWNTMKQRKRCIVIAEGFYEWKKENNGKVKIPHHIKRKDGALMYLAGLWDMVQYEGSGEKLYTHTIITTDSNSQLKFLHDRMPVILEPASSEMEQWLDPTNIGWSKELQAMLKPFTGELECYTVDKAVGKVGNNSPNFVVPLDSKENKSNIANFFGTQRATAEDVAAKNAAVKHENWDDDTTDRGHDGDNRVAERIKDSTSALSDEALIEAADDLTEKNIKHEMDEVDDASLLKASQASSPDKRPNGSVSKSASPVKKTPVSSKRKRNATSNETVPKTPNKITNAKITSFFGGK